MVWACRAAATHCVTDSPGPCPASCSPAECGWARQSHGSPSSPRMGTRLTAALDVVNIQFLSDLLKAPHIKIVWIFCKQQQYILAKHSKNKNRKNYHTAIWSVNATAWCRFVQTGICELLQNEVEWKHCQKSQHVPSRSTKITGRRPGGQCLSVSLINIQNNRSRKWPTYCTDILPYSPLAASLCFYMVVHL